MADAQKRWIEQWRETSVERGEVRVRIDGIPSRTSSVGGEAIIPGAIAEGIEAGLDRIFGAVERAHVYVGGRWVRRDAFEGPESGLIETGSLGPSDPER